MKLGDACMYKTLTYSVVSSNGDVLPRFVTFTTTPFQQMISTIPTLAEEVGSYLFNYIAYANPLINETIKITIDVLP